ncbi:MAG: SMC-Scp complex subunit ScpB [Pseudomonadota bacterium]
MSATESEIAAATDDATNEHEVESLGVFLEAALLASDAPLSLDQLQKIAQARASTPKVGKPLLRQALEQLSERYADRGLELVEVGSGYRVQLRPEMMTELTGLFEERPPRYSRAFFETLALIAYRQPITRGEIEDIRGVAVSTNIIRSMMEREWIRVVGHRDVPGKPAMFGTTKAFLDYFNLKTLDELPSLAELTDIESLKIQLDLPSVEDGSSNPPAIAQISDSEAADAAEDVDEQDTEAEEET